MNVSHYLSISVVSLSVVFCGCGFHYTQHAHTPLKNSKIQSKSFVVFPIADVQITSPSGCMGRSSSFNPEGAAIKWQQEIVEKLRKHFPNQQWNLLVGSDEFFHEDTKDIGYILSVAKQTRVTTSVSLTQSTPLRYENLPADKRLQPILSELQETKGIDYVIMFHSASLTGEIETNYNYNATTGGSFSSTTYYTGDIVIQVWDCASGQLLYNSGAWEKTSGFCFFVSPEEMAISQTSSDLVHKLLNIIEVILAYQEELKFADSQ